MTLSEKILDKFRTKNESLFGLTVMLYNEIKKLWDAHVGMEVREFLTKEKFGLDDRGIKDAVEFFFETDLFEEDMWKIDKQGLFLFLKKEVEGEE